MLAGVAIALPYVAFEFWLFAAPGLKPRERLFGLIGIPLAAIFFIGGMAFTYYLLLPSALPFPAEFPGHPGANAPAIVFLFVTGLLFWIGIAFEFPLVIYVLTAIGLDQAECPGQAMAHRGRHHRHRGGGHHSDCGPGQYGAGDAAHDRVIFHQYWFELHCLCRTTESRMRDKTVEEGSAMKSRTRSAVIARLFAFWHWAALACTFSLIPDPDHPGAIHPVADAGNPHGNARFPKRRPSL